MLRYAGRHAYQSQDYIFVQMVALVMQASCVPALNVSRVAAELACASASSFCTPDISTSGSATARNSSGKRRRVTASASASSLAEAPVSPRTGLRRGTASKGCETGGCSVQVQALSCSPPRAGRRTASGATATRALARVPVKPKLRRGRGRRGGAGDDDNGLDWDFFGTGGFDGPSDGWNGGDGSWCANYRPCDALAAMLARRLRSSSRWPSWRLLFSAKC